MFPELRHFLVIGISSTRFSYLLLPGWSSLLSFSAAVMVYSGIVDDFPTLFPLDVLVFGVLFLFFGFFMIINVFNIWNFLVSILKAVRSCNSFTYLVKAAGSFHSFACIFSRESVSALMWVLFLFILDLIVEFIKFQMPTYTSGLELFRDISHFNDIRSVKVINFLAYEYDLNFSVVQTIGSSSLSTVL